ncbi:MAG: mevalonate kinase [Enterococcus sp.]
MSTQKGIGIANGKIILMGEHAVVYGEPAIAFPFSGTTVTATLTTASSPTLTSSYYNGPLEQVPTELTSIQTLVQRLTNDYQSPACHITIESTIPAERGMGSSAAVAVAITRAFFAWQKIAYDTKQLLAYVNQSEVIAHGNPSGIDAAATSGHDPILFEKGQPFTTFALNIDAHLIVADTGVKGKTRETVKDVRALMEQHPQTTLATIQQLGQLVNDAKQAIVLNQATELGMIMNQAHHYLQQLGVSDATLDNLITCARENGALGAKLTGGGRGGCMIALAQSALDAKKIAHKLTQAGAKSTWIQELGVYEYA